VNCALCLLETDYADTICAGVNSNVDKGASSSEGNIVHKRLVEMFCVLLQTRLKKSAALLVKVRCSIPTCVILCF
jgi:hypothetical protein